MKKRNVQIKPFLKMFQKLQLETGIKCNHEGGQVKNVKGKKQNYNLKVSTKSKGFMMG